MPKVAKTTVDGVADTGAQICLWGLSAFHKAGFKKSQLVRVKQRIVAANRQPVDISGAVFLKLEAGSYCANVMVFVTPDVNGLYISRQVCIILCFNLTKSSSDNDCNKLTLCYETK